MTSPKTYAAFLFDMDGTLLSSTVAAERAWTRWAQRHDVDLETFLPTIHGVRSQDTIAKLNLPGIDVEAEAAWLDNEEATDVQGVVPINGVIDFLKRLPPDRWAVVTSANIPLMKARMGAAGLEPPAVLITAEDVQRGKPDPQGYRMAAERLGVDVTDCLIFEDAPAGIGAAEAAGADVVVVSAAWTHPIETPHPRLTDYDAVRLTVHEDDRLSLDL